MNRTGLAVALGLSLVGAGCGEPANVAGNYSVSLTNQENGCNFSNWTVGQMASGVGLVVTQSGSDLTAIVQGGAGALLVFALGSASFTGTVNGQTLGLKIFGTRQATQGSCSYTLNAELNATLVGDLLQGTISYRSATNGSPDCGSIQDCVSTQAFNGTRPPSAQ